MIIDVCNDPSKEGEPFCDNPANRHDELTVLHTYVDDFYVTGVTVEEQHGLDIAILYENPLSDPDLTLRQSSLAHWLWFDEHLCTWQR